MPESVRVDKWLWAVRIFKTRSLSTEACKKGHVSIILDFVEDVTPASEMELLEMQRNMRWSARDRGTGRPTKKDRRELDDFFEA